MWPPREGEGEAEEAGRSPREREGEVKVCLRHECWLCANLARVGVILHDVLVGAARHHDVLLVSVRMDLSIVRGGLRAEVLGERLR